MKISDGMAVLEAILFACGEPIDITKLSAAADMDTDTALKLIEQLNERYDAHESGLHILKLGDSFQLSTREKFAPNIKLALESKRQVPLSQAAMEVLAIIAYNQPVTKGFVEQVRGIDSSSVVNSLVERNLLEEHGRLDLPGRPIAYRTTDNFLRCFKMSDLKELPPLPNNSDQVNFDEIEELNRSEEYGGSADIDDSADGYENAEPEGEIPEQSENEYSAGDSTTEALPTDDVSHDKSENEATPQDSPDAENAPQNEDADDESDNLDDLDIADEEIDSIDDTLKIISDNIAELTSDN